MDLSAPGYRPWLDEWEILGGESIPTRVSEGIEEANLVVVLSSASVASQWVENEWQAKYWKEISTKRVSIIPVLLNDCAVPTLLAPRKYIDLGQLAFGICALLFGGAHFVYMNLTAPLVPKWLPPSQEFWAYATGVGHIAAGVAILTGVQTRLAAILLTAMYASFTLLVHLPMLLTDPSSHMNWSENALNLALIGTALVVADSLVQPRRKQAAREHA